MQVQAYLFFDGRCEEALNYYRTALGAEIGMLMRFKDSPEPCESGMPPGNENKVMHASFKLGETEIMASDGCSDGAITFQGFSLSLNLKDEAQAQKCFAALADGGEVRMALGKTFWSPCFGMLADRFGVAWMVNVVP